MAIEINLRITLAAGEEFTPYEDAILAAVARRGDSTAAAPSTAVVQPREAEAEAVPEAEPVAPKRTRRTKAQIVAEEKAAAEAAAAAAVDEEAADAEDAEVDDDTDLLGTEPEPEEATTQDAVDAATVVLTAGGTAKVKAALKKAGVKRVAELTKPADIAAFIADLQD